MTKLTTSLKFITILFITLMLQACGSKGATLFGNPSSVSDSKFNTTTKYSGLDQKTARYITKSNLVQASCELQTVNHNAQRLEFELAPPVIINNGIAVDLRNHPTTKYYNRDISPFDMKACIVDGMKGPVERTIALVVNTVKDLGTKALEQSPYYWLYKAASKDRVNVGGDGAIVNTGEGDLNYNPDNRTNSCIEEGTCVTPVEEEPEGEPPVEEEPEGEPPIEEEPEGEPPVEDNS